MNDLLKTILFLRSQGMLKADDKTLQELGHNPALTIDEVIAKTHQEAKKAQTDTETIKES